MEVISKNAKDLMNIGKCLGKSMNQSTIILLDGELGAGKTTLTKGIAEGLGITETINSPTFTIAKMYEGRMILNHLDVYRLEGLDEDLGIEDYVSSNEVLVVEWSKFINKNIFDEYLHIEIFYHGDQRKLKFNYIGNYYKQLVEKVEVCII